ncbi:hypothetical protein [Ureibacillus endophyticus]|uniref:Uncharacterized protein n=1 Tax=Ureibacillus endophyticus TaxID=1978490 RepID=A0A494YY00_9BACL|nr:hypothetical protein [Lysinibacillus endophyticus]RKQ15108.1 hypothetical protein D8M03_12525 [Lysinibacillus endophyticus]
MNYKQWLLTTAILTTLFCSPFLYMIFYNYYVDPLWNFNHQNKANESQIAFDERQLKVNYISHQNQFDSLLVGTSRTTYINQHDFKDMSVYNFSAGSLTLGEYGPYIRYATEQNKKEFETIILELYPTGNLDEALVSSYPEPETYFETTNAPLYSIKSLFSFDTYEKAKNNASDETPKGFRIYDRNNVVSLDTVDNKTVQSNINRGLKKLGSVKESKDLTEYKKALYDIKEASPNSKFIVYSPPFFHERLAKIFKKEGGIQLYRDWLEACIEVFDGVVNFTTINDISLNVNNYFDTNHFYPSTGTYIAKDIVAFNNGHPLQYATYVNTDNIDAFIEQFREQMKEYR